MKNILIALVLLAGTAHADVIFTTQNKAGGIIALTDVKCANGGYAVYATQATSNASIFGCWQADNMNVIIRWDSGDSGIFPLSGWIAVGKKGAAL